MDLPIELIFKWANEREIHRFSVLPTEPVSSIKNRLSPYIPEARNAFTLTCKSVLLQDTFTLAGLPSGSIVYVVPGQESMKISPDKRMEPIRATRRHTSQDTTPRVSFPSFFVFLLIKMLLY